MLDISITLVVIAHIVVSLLLILVILMQRPKQEGLGAAFGSGVTDAAWGARTTDVLQKGTVYLGSLFFIFSLVLAILMGKRNGIDSKNFASDGASAPQAPIEAPAAVTTPVDESEVDAPVPDLLGEGAAAETVIEAVEAEAAAAEAEAAEEAPAPAEAPASE